MADPGIPAHVEWLRQELVRWQQASLITRDQASRILAGYQGQEALVARTQTQRRIVAVLGALGAILVGLGVILFFASNWEAIPKWVRFSLVFLATAGAYAAGYWLRFVRAYAGVGNAVLLLGALLYGAGIFLVGQMFHVQAEPHYGLLLWAAGVLPLAYLLPSREMITLSAALLAVWAMIVAALGGDRYGVYSEVFTIRVGFAAGVFLYGVGRLHDKLPAGRHFGRPYLITGALVVFLTYYVYTFFVTDFGRASTSDAFRAVALPPPLWILQTGVTLLGVAALLATVLLQQDRNWALAELGLLGGLLTTLWIVPPGAPGLAWIATAVGSGWLWAVLINLLFFGASLGAAMAGVQRSDRGLVNIGLVFFSLAVAGRYVDVVGRLITTSIFFIGGGLLLLGGGWLIERTRRRLLLGMGRADEGA